MMGVNAAGRESWQAWCGGRTGNKKPAARYRAAGFGEQSSGLLADLANQLFHNLAAFDFVDDLLVLGADGAAAGVLLGGMQTGLLDVPGCYFEVLIDVHGISSLG
jgi:hypothetical protein